MKIGKAALAAGMSMAFSLSNLVSGANRVAIQADADLDYLSARSVGGGSASQRYRVIEGQFNRGGIADASLDAISFSEIADGMASGMAQRGFSPSRLEEDNELLVVLHYGRMPASVSGEELLGINSLDTLTDNAHVLDGASYGGIDDDINALASLDHNLQAARKFTSANAQTAYYHAQVIGLEGAYSSEASPSEERRLKRMLSEDRYYMSLMAYDFQRMQRGELELLWTTRCSIRAAGQDFPNAIRKMQSVAGDYYGRKFKGVKSRRVSVK